MPKIATYEPDQVQTSLTKGPKTSANLLDLRSLKRGVSDLGNAALDVRNRIDTTAAEEALIKFEKAKNDVLFNPENGYYNNQGRNAYDNAPGAIESLEKLKNDLGTDLNPNSRKMFNGVADKHLIRSSADISRHSAKGLKVWEVATIEAQVENTIENAALYWNNPKDLKVQRILGEEAILDSAELTGIGPEATNEKLQTYRSKFTVSAVDFATARSSADGQKVLNENEELLEPQDKVKLQKNIDAKKKAEKTQSDAVKATLTATRLVDDYDSRKEIQEEVNKIKDPELKKKTMAESMTMFSRKKQAESEEQADVFENAERHIEAGGTVEVYKASDPEGWEKLSPAQRKSLTKNEPVETDWNKYSKLMTLPKDQLAKINPVDYFDQLNKTERKSLISAVKTAKGASSTSQKTESQVGRTRTAEVKAAVIQLFGDKKSKFNLKRIDSFYSLVDSEVRYREDIKGSKLTSVEFTNVLAGFTREAVHNRDFFWDKKVSFDDIPTEDVEALSDNLRSKGIPVTTENLSKLYEQVK